MTVYLDYAASTPLANEVFEAMLPWFREHYGNPSSIHGHGRVLRACIEKCRRQVADELGCPPGSIIFTSGGTEADNLAIKSAVRCYPVRLLVTAPTEHHAVLHPIESLSKELGLNVHYLSVDSEGFISIDELNEVLDGRPAGEVLVSLMHANNETGALLDLEAVARCCAEHGALFHSDTVQTIGQLPINLQEVPVHFLTASAHKFYGPQGAGFLYCSPDVQLPPQICGGGQERNRRSGTENVAGIVGTATAFVAARRQARVYAEHTRRLKESFRQQLRERIPGVVFNGPQDDAHAMPSVLNVSFPGEGTESILIYQLDMKGISVSGGSACSSGSAVGSHVLRAMGLPPERVAHAVRFSFGRDTTPEQLAYVVDVLAECLAPVAARLRK